MANRKLRQLPLRRTNDMIKMPLRIGPGIWAWVWVRVRIHSRDGFSPQIRAGPPSISPSISMALCGFGGVLYVTIAIHAAAAANVATLQCKFFGEDAFGMKMFGQSTLSAGIGTMMMMMMMVMPPSHFQPADCSDHAQKMGLSPPAAQSICPPALGFFC